MRFVRLALLAGLLLIADAAYGSDGVIEINQAMALAGGVTSGDAPGFPVTLSMPGAYRLTGNLDVQREGSPQNKTAIEVMADDISIDLGGFALIGPTACGGFPFSCTPIGTGRGVQSSFDRTRVRAGAVRGFGGIGVLLGSRSIAEDLEISNCGGGGLQASSSARVAGNVIALNGSFGINASGTIQGNVVQGNAGTGIRMVGNALVTHNVSTGNTSYGIEIVVGSALVTGNTVTSNGQEGLALGATTAYSGNTVVGNNGLGENPQVSGGVQIGTNLCNTDTICP